MQPNCAAIASCHGILSLLFLLTYHAIGHAHLGQQQAPVAKNDQESKTNFKILIPNLPPHHYQFWLRNHPIAARKFAEICAKEPNVLEISDRVQLHELFDGFHFENPHHGSNIESEKFLLNKICSVIDIVPKSCWGYESNCANIHLMPKCFATDPAKEKNQTVSWFSNTDFGYVLNHRREMNKYCSPNKNINDSIVSSFHCTKHFTTCRGDHLYLRVNISSSTNGKILSNDDVGGWNCDFQRKRVMQESGQEGKLQSWFNELKYYKRFLGKTEVCSHREELQTIFVKLDTGGDMFDYFSNFVNLYATLHLNNQFSDNNKIIFWDKMPSNRYSMVWRAFSRYPPQSIEQFHGQQVCFNKFIFALPPRMVDSLYHKTSLVEGCSKSGLYDAFSKHVLHRLGIAQLYSLDLHTRTLNKLIRVIILTRPRGKPYRHLINQNELEMALENHPKRYFIQTIDYESSDNFLTTLTCTSNADILIGLHGSGLTHALFLPDWATLIELYDCGDPKYRNLARLRGIEYLTAPKEDSLVARSSKTNSTQSDAQHDDKMADYEVSIKKFLELFDKAVVGVMKRRESHFGEVPATVPTRTSSTTTSKTTTRMTRPAQAEPDKAKAATTVKTHEEL